jgi:hypothetical protein
VAIAWLEYAAAARYRPLGSPENGNDAMEADRVFRLILARCGDALDQAEMAAVEAALSGSDAISREVAELIEDVLSALDQRLERLEETVAA